jgi:uncharacterized delta-60 repeat protein
VLQPVGKLVAAGYSVNGPNEDFALARYNPEGSLDPTFNGTGKVTTAIGREAEAYALVLQPDGKLAAAGFNAFENSDCCLFALTRYNPNGSLDPSFNGTGKVETGFSDGAYALVLQPDGKLVAAGGTMINTGTEFVFALARYLGKAVCVVPKVKGKTLGAAKRAIRKASCSVDKVTKAFSAKVKKGRVIAQTPRPGKRLAAGSKVKLTVSKGKRARRWS